MTSLHSRYEGHVGNRNPILGIGHSSYDEAGFDIEGKSGPGTRAELAASNRRRSTSISQMSPQYWEQQQPQQQGYAPLQIQRVADAVDVVGNQTVDRPEHTTNAQTHKDRFDDLMSDDVTLVDVVDGR